MIDSHAHIYLDKFEEDRNEIIERAIEAGVSMILMPNIDHTCVDDMLETELSFPTQTRSMIGLHPCSVDKKFEKELYEVENWIGKHPFIAVGEIGTDLYWDKTYFEQQKEAFKIQCELALRHNLPVVIHCRESIDENIELVKPYVERGLTGVFHCFTGTVEQGMKIMDLGFYLGIGGVATFKNGGMDKILPELGLSHLLLETDSPYLAPAPHRGKRNEPSFLSLIRNQIAAILEKDQEDVEEVTISNTRKLFNLR